jgi:uncharacterized protein YjlB
MVIRDQLKNVARKIVESRPSEQTLRRSVRSRKARTIMFTDDGIVPNHPRWPLIVYRGAVLTHGIKQPEVLIDALFAANEWGRSWRDTIYDFVHYHSRIHEVLGVARGSAVVEFGGVKGRRLALKAGDVAILPAGTGHRLIEASRGFLVVGAYPPSGTYDECTDSRDRPGARKRIAKVKKPVSDPVYGKTAGIKTIWNKRGK